MDTKIFGLIGEKLSHSHSPKIHTLFGCEEYKLYEMKKEELCSFLSQENIGGLNITIPYKVDALKLCDEVSDEAKSIGCVNTVVQRDKKLYGYNTDKDGFLYMVKRSGIDFKDKKVLILGSGGASRTVVYCSKLLLAKEVIIISRNGENNYDNISLHYDADIIVNTTPVGMYPNNDSLPIDLLPFKKLCGVLDLIYNPLSTRFILQAKQLNIACAGGIYMLVFQAKRAQEIFFDKTIPEEKLSSVCEKIIRDCKNIVLIGMPGCGKSTIGKILGKMSGRQIFDTDSMICEYEGKSIPEIFAKKGEDYFRVLETRAVKEAGSKSGVIITTGGGVVTRKENYFFLAQNAKIFRLVRDISCLETCGRPLSKDIDTLKKLEIQREPMYSYFEDIRIRNNSTAEECADKIWRDFCENSCD